MYQLLGVIFIILGCFMIFWPKVFYNITQGWKNSSDTEPSHSFIFSTRFGGIMFIIVGVAAVIVQFLSR